MSAIEEATLAEERLPEQSPSPDASNIVPSGSPQSVDADAESKVKKTRNTIILREVDPEATEDQIRALFANSAELKVVSVREDVQNTWFVQMETEEQAKQAVLLVSNMTLCNKPVKARIKSEPVLRTSAPVWQPTTGRAPLFMHPTATFPASGTTAAFQAPGQTSPPPGVVRYGGWGNSKSTSETRPGSSGAFKKMATNASQTSNATQQSGQRGEGSRSGQRKTGERSSTGQRSGSASGGDRRGRKPTGHASPQTSKPVAFQPQDFPSLSGTPPTEPSVPQSHAQEAPAHSWAAIAKTAPEIPVPKKKESSSQRAAPSTVESKTSKDETPLQAVNVAASSAQTVSQDQGDKPEQVENKILEKPSSPSTEQDQGDQQAKRRGWEKPGLPQVIKTSPPPTENAAVSTSAPANVSSQSGAERGNKRSSERKKGDRSRGGDREDKQANGHNSASSDIPPVQPPVWGSKSFAQVIKEKPAPVAPQHAPSATTTPLLPTLQRSESWGDDEEDEVPKTNPSGSNQPSSRISSSRTSVQQERLTPSAENSDWRRDAAVRRKNEEQQAAARASGRRANGS